MNRIATVVLVISFVLLNGCATHTRTASPVVLNISSTTATNGFINEVRDTTLDAIAAQVPNARPLTIKVDLEVATKTRQGTSLGAPQPNQQHAVATLSPDPYNEAAPPTVPVNTGFGSERLLEITDYRLSYTISDAEGRVVESNQLTLDRGRLVDMATATPAKGLYIRDPLSLRYELVSNTAGFLAARVKMLSQ